MPTKRMKIEDLWDYLPDEAVYIARDKDGEYFWWSRKPVRLDDEYWDISDRAYAGFYSYGPIAGIAIDWDGDWQDSLHKRPVGRWRPETGDEYWFVADNGQCYERRHIGILDDWARINAGNYFRTKEQAEPAAELVRAAFGGAK